MSELSFEGRVALITGAGRGLGRAHALLLAERGATVIVNDLAAEGEDSAADAVVAEIVAGGGSALAVQCSVADADSAQGLVQESLAAYGRVDILINNAGIVRDRTIAKMTPDLLDPVLDVHLKGAVHLCRAVWPAMRDQGYGRILNTSSNVGILGAFGQSNYGAAKMGLVGLAKVLAQEGKKYGITANVIAPVARTRMTEEVLGGSFAALLDPDLVSPVAAWLVHQDCETTGAIFSVGGGRVAQFFIGLTNGIYDANLSPETVRDCMDEISDREDYSVWTSAAEELEQLRTIVGEPGAVPRR
jgi:NAD(P)-dependent dehydrogenase (short-subunit alcohol dehydrogenase family)